MTSFLYAEEEVWIDELKGIILSDDESKLERAPDSLNGICFFEFDVPKKWEFRRELEPFLGKPVCAQFLQGLKNTIVRFYREHNYPVVAVVIPSGQEITHGVIRLAILIGKVGEVQSRGARWFSNEKIKKEFRLKEGEEITENKVLCDLDWINQNPFLETDIILEPGKTLRETDMILVTKDRFPFRAYTAYENTGNIIAGTSRFLAGFNWANLFQWNHQLNALFLTAPNFTEWWAVTASYVAPFMWRHLLEVNGAFSRTRPKDESLDLTGKAWQTSFKYIIPFWAWFFNCRFNIGYEFKRTNNFLTVGTTLVFDDYFDICQFVSSFETSIDYPMGITTLAVYVYYSPGNLSHYNKTRIFEQEREGAKAGYVYGKFRFDQTLKMPKNFSWVLNVAFQQSNKKLLPNEEFSLGGYFTVRGYDENEVISDNGLLIKTEVRTPKWTYQPSRKPRKHQLQFLAFLDFGVAYDTDSNILSKYSTALASFGPAIRYNYNDNIKFRFDYGWQLHAITRVVDDSSRDSRAHLGLTVAF